MARLFTLTCDRCEKTENRQVKVITGSTRRTDGVKLNVDLCRACWSELERDYGFHSTVKPGKRFQVVDINDISNL
jgi:hypothetical protein